MEQAAGVKDSKLVLPTGPDGYRRAGSGLFVPEREPTLKLEPIPKLNEPTLLLGAEAINAYPYDILEGTEAPASTYEPAYLWYDAPAALNRVIDSASLDSLKEKFGKLQQLSERDKLLSVLNSRSSEEELAAITSDFYSLLGEVHVRAGSEVLEDALLWDYLGVMADYLMIESDMQDLTMNEDTLQLILRGLDNHDIPEKLLDFIAHFDIPRELAGKLIDRIDEYPNHPLYWWVASRCPDHPVVAQQRRAVEALAAGDENAFAHLNPETLLPLGGLLPDRTFPRTGLELETTTFVDAVKVPEGTVMGYDSAKGVDGILELRLNHEEDRSVLNYGPEWLHRYFKVWLWEKIARGVSSSIHLHSDGNPPVKLERAKSLFGVGNDSCRYNPLGTVEVRSALDGYIDKKLDGRGYSELPPPALIELLHLVEDIDSPLFLAVRGRLGQTVWRSRVGDHDKYSRQVGEQLLESLKNNDRKASRNLFRRVAGLEHDVQAAIVKAAIKSGEHDLLISHLGSFNFELQKVIANAYDDICTNPYLIGQIDLLEPQIRMAVITGVLMSDDASSHYYLAHGVSGLTQDQQRDLVSAVIRKGDINAFDELAWLISELTSLELRDCVVQETIQRDYGKYIDALISQFDSLNSERQNYIIDRELGDEGRHIQQLVWYVGMLNPQQQDRVIEYLLNSGKVKSCINALIHCYHQIKNDTLRTKCLNYAYKRSSPFQQIIIRCNTGRRNEAKLRRMP